MATDGVQEIDLSGTDVIAYSSVADSAAAQLLRLSDGTLTDIEIQDAFSNYDGPRRVRVRYDTPEFYGFTAATAYGRDLLSDDADTRDENIFDASVVYGNEVSDVEFEAGIGYYWQENNTTQLGRFRLGDPRTHGPQRHPGRRHPG